MIKSDLKIGDLVTFKIGSREGYSDINKGKWGALTVLDLGSNTDQSFSVSVKSGLWNRPPRKWQITLSSLLIEKRFQKLDGKGKAQACIITTSIDGTIDLHDPKIAGTALWFNATERDARRYIAQHGHFSTIANLSHAAHVIDHEHRARHDFTAWKAEILASRAAFDQKNRDRSAREQSRLRHVNLALLQSEILFAEWDKRTAIVPPAYATAVRAQSADILTQFTQLGDRPKRKEVRKILRSYVDALNALDGKHGYQIETEEREDLMCFIEELCWATKQKPLLSEVDEWRTW